MRVNVDFREQEQRIPVSISEGGAGGTSNYNQLKNKPKINGVELVGDKSAEDLGLRNSTFWFGTRAEYNALPTIDPDVAYCIEEGT